jgi:hypothetical protein
MIYKATKLKIKLCANFFLIRKYLLHEAFDRVLLAIQCPS